MSDLKFSCLPSVAEGSPVRRATTTSRSQVIFRFVPETETLVRKVKVVSVSVLTISADPLSITVGTGGAAGAGVATGSGAAAGASPANARANQARAVRQRNARRQLISRY